MIEEEKKEAEVQMIPQQNSSDELDLEGKHSKANLVKLLDVISVHLKSVFFRHYSHLKANLDTNDQLTKEQQIHVRLINSEDMVKNAFPDTTEDILKEQKPALSYDLFQKWIKAFNDDEPAVTDFLMLASKCALKIIDTSTDGPNLDFSADLP